MAMRSGYLPVIAGLLLLFSGCLTSGVQSKDYLLPNNAFTQIGPHQDASIYRFGCSNSSVYMDSSLCAGGKDPDTLAKELENCATLSGTQKQNCINALTPG
jgi:hypothetical protein